MDNEFISRLVAKVVRRLATRLGADGSRGVIVCVFTGCSDGVDNAVTQMRNLIMKGFKLNLLFSENARQTYRKSIIQGLDGFPHVASVNSSSWYEDLNRADAVIAPITSLNTVSRLSMLMADSVHTQFMLNAMTMGKLLIISQSDILPQHLKGSKKSRRPFAKGASLLTALDERLANIENYGGVLCDISELSSTLLSYIGEKERDESVIAQSKQVSELSHPSGNNSTIPSSTRTKHVTEKVITASFINLAANGKYDLSFNTGVIITPMAKDLASRKGVTLQII